MRCPRGTALVVPRTLEQAHRPAAERRQFWYILVHRVDLECMLTHWVCMHAQRQGIQGNHGPDPHEHDLERAHGCGVLRYAYLILCDQKKCTASQAAPVLHWR